MTVVKIFRSIQTAFLTSSGAARDRFEAYYHETFHEKRLNWSTNSDVKITVFDGQIFREFLLVRYLSHFKIHVFQNARYHTFILAE